MTTNPSMIGDAGASAAWVPIGSLPAYHAARLGEAGAAVRLDDDVLTWGELEARANRRARALATYGVGLGDFVAVARRADRGGERGGASFEAPLRCASQDEAENGLPACLIP